MASALNQFNPVSAIYDRMAGLVFGSTLFDAQCHFISAIPDRCKVLVLGGGTGKFLKELLTRKPDVEVIYIEASSKMIARSKKTVGDNSRVTFIHGTQDSSPRGLKVDVVITPFFLDLFSDRSLKKCIEQLRSALVENGIWIATDFTHPKKMSYRFLLWLMYRFFRLTTHMEARKLPAWEGHLSIAGKQIDGKTFKNDFIKTALYRVNE